MPSPQRIVSLVPSITETLADLGCDQEVVGVTHYCEEPPHWRQTKTRVGGTKLKDATAILALRPDLVILNKEENLLTLAEQLDAAHIPCLVTYPRTFKEALEMILQLGEAVDRRAAANKMITAIEQERQALAPVPFTYLSFIWKKPYMTIADDTFMHAMLQLIGGANDAQKLSGGKRYFEISATQIGASKADWLLFPDEPYKFSAVDLDEFIMEFPQLPAVASHRLLVTAGKELTWFGSRMLRGVRFLRQLQEQMRSSQS